MQMMTTLKPDVEQSSTLVARSGNQDSGRTGCRIPAARGQPDLDRCLAGEQYRDRREMVGQ